MILDRTVVETAVGEGVSVGVCVRVDVGDVGVEVGVIVLVGVGG